MRRGGVEVLPREGKGILALQRVHAGQRHELAHGRDQAAHALHAGTDRTRALAPALAEWLGSEHFRGCAFINSVSELGDTVPEVLEIAQRHKRDMTALLAGLLPALAQRAQIAQALTLVVEGAIVRVQMGAPVAEVVAAVSRLTDGLVAAPLSCKR